MHKSIMTLKECVDAEQPTSEATFAASDGCLASIPYKCPKCDGQGIVSKPPWVAGDVHQWSSTEVTFECDVCHGSKIIWGKPDNESSSPTAADSNGRNKQNYG